MLRDYVSHVHPDQAMHGRQWDATRDTYFTWINSSAMVTVEFWDSSATAVSAIPMLVPPGGFTAIPKAWDLVTPPPCSKESAEKGMFPST